MDTAELNMHPEAEEAFQRVLELRSDFQETVGRLASY
jgi:hypothetical protein